MKPRDAASRTVFVRYTVTYLLILALPLAAAAISFRISTAFIRRDIDAITVEQLERSMAGIERSLADLQKMSIQISDNSQVGYYLARPGPLTGIEMYNLKGISERLASYVLSSSLLSHCFLVLEKSDTLVSESGFAAYDDFYGTLFSVEGYTAREWRDRFLDALPDGELFLPRQTVRVGGQQTVAHLYRRSIGYGDYRLGAIVGIVDGPTLDRMLADLPRRYGGWAFVQDTEGRLVGSTDADLARVAAVRDRAGASDRVEWEGETYRLYRRTSAVNGWQYTAVLGETLIFQGVRRASLFTFLILAIAGVAGLGAAWMFAASNTRPLTRVFHLLLGDRAGTGLRLAGVYDQVETAVRLLSDSNRRLAREADEAGRIGTAWFFQNLLRGDYASREAFAKDQRTFRVSLPERPRYVVLCRLAALHAARGAAAEQPREALRDVAERHAADGDIVVPVSYDDVAVICGAGGTRDRRTAALALVEAMRGSLAQAIRGDVFIGIGRAMEDPFLLSISHREAAAAVSALIAEGRETMLFYEDLSGGAATYYYPLDLEESVMRAARSANADLLDSLLGVIRRENLVARRLGPVETHNLLVELQGTVRRLLNELPDEAGGDRAALEGIAGQDPGADGLDGIFSLFQSLRDWHGRRKRSHNTTLLAAIEEYIAAHFARHDLGLTVIADALGISENYLSSFYKEQTGEGLLAAIHRIRFGEAARLLRSTDETIDAVARRCGYVNTSSFRRAFRQRFGFAPSRLKSDRGAAPPEA